MSCCFFKTTLFLIPILMLLSFGSCNGRIFTFEMHHRFSDEVKQWSDSTGRFAKFPPKGSFEYFNALVLRDWLIRGRRLSESESESESSLTFSDGNSTSRISSLGLLVSFCSQFLIKLLCFRISLILFYFLFQFFLYQFALHDGEIGYSGNEIHGGA